MTRPPPKSTLFPYTTLFRSGIKKLTALPSDYAALHVAVNAEELHFLSAAQKQAIKHLLQEKDRKSTRLNSSHMSISYAVFCLKKKKKKKKKTEYNNMMNRND